MTTLSLLFNRGRRESYDHVRHMVRIVERMEGGPRSWDTVERLAKSWGVQKSEVDQIRKNPSGIHEAVPKDKVTCSRQLYDLIEVMISEGKFQESAVFLVHARADQMDFKHAVVKGLIEQVQSVVRDRKVGPENTSH